MPKIYKNGQLVTINNHVFRVVTKRSCYSTCIFCEYINERINRPCVIAAKTEKSTFTCLALNPDQTLKFVK